MLRLIEIIRARFHRHDWKRVPGLEPVGVTLGWDLRPTTEYETTERCECGAERKDRGWVLPRAFEDLREATSGNVWRGSSHG